MDDSAALGQLDIRDASKIGRQPGDDEAWPRQPVQNIVRQCVGCNYSRWHAAFDDLDPRIPCLAAGERQPVGDPLRR